jgi:bleomycin hydrolase
MTSINREVVDDDVNKYRASFAADVHAKVVQNALTANCLVDLTANRQLAQETDSSFSVKLDKWSVTNQKSSGRCWLFAFLNVFRVGAMKKLNLKEFEFSQAYIHFWDKFERANQLLESIIETAGRDVDDRTVAYLLESPIIDGGQWNMAQSLIRKHGLVPKSAFPESTSSSNTLRMNMILKKILRKSAQELRVILTIGGTLESARIHKNARLAEVWKVLCIHLGTPPKSFDWQWRDKDDVFHRKGVMTPQEFAKEYVLVDWEKYYCIVHDPRNPTMQTYTVDFLQGVAGAPPIVYLNLEIETLKDMTRRMLQDGLPVWFGCDVGQQFDRKAGIWDTNIFEYDAFYGIDGLNKGLCKADRLLYHETMMTHAMLFTGMDVAEDGQTVRRWRVENSWGDTGGQKGFYTMNDIWFNEHMFEIAVPREYMSEEMMRALQAPPTVLPAWDPMGSLATVDLDNEA